MQKVQSRGQLSIPANLRRKSGISPGDSVIMSMVGPGELRITTFRPMPLDEIFATYGACDQDGPYDDRAIREEWEAEAGNELLDRIRLGVE